MGVTCSTVGREEKYMLGIGFEKLKKSNHLRVIKVD
jgi:hypothetical protein